MTDENKFTLSQIGAWAQGRDPEKYGSMTAIEAATDFLEENPDLWVTVKDDALGEQIAGGFRDTAGNRFTRMSGFGGVADDLAAMRPRQPLMGQISLGIQEGALRLPGTLIDEAVSTYNAFRPSKIGETWEGMKGAAEGMGRSAVRNIGTRDDSILGRAIGQTGGPEFSFAPSAESTSGMWENTARYNRPARSGTEQFASAMMTDAQDKLLDPEEWINNPGGNLLMASGLIPTPAVLPRFSSFINAVNPAIIALRAGGGVGKGVKGVASLAGREYAGLMTGRGAEAISEAYRIIRSAPKKVREAFYDYVDGHNSLLNFHSMAIEALHKVQRQRSKNWKKLFPTMKLRRDPESIHKRIKIAVKDVLSDFKNDSPDINSANLRRMGIWGDDEGLVREWLSVIDDPSLYYNRSGVLDVEAFDSIRQITWQVSRKLDHGLVGQKMVEQAYDRIRDVLVDNIKGGYDDMLGQWRKTSELIGGFEAATGVKTGAMSAKDLGKARIAAIRNLIKSLKDDPANQGAKEMIEQLSEAAGVPILAAATGALFNNWIGSGLISRAAAAGLILAFEGAVTQQFGWNALWLLTQAPLVSPKMVGRGIIPVLGYTSRQKDHVMSLLNNIHSRIPKGWDTAGMTYFQAAQRLTEEHNIKVANGGFKPLAKTPVVGQVIRAPQETIATLNEDEPGDAPSILEGIR